MPRYCPLGTPSLLNGDFSENVARLKDFSWSVFLSSNPIKAEPSIGTAIVTYVEHHPQQLLIAFLVLAIYTAIYAWICHKCISCMKIEVSRNLVVLTMAFGACLCVSFAALLVIHRQIPEMAFSALSLAYFHITIPYFVFQNKCSELLPSAKGYLGFRSTSLRIVFAVIVVLAFFFTPSIPHQDNECPHKFYRVMSELYFWTTFAYIFMSYNCIHYTIYADQTDVFYIWQKSGTKKHKEVIGQLKKKDGYGWIKDYYNEPLVVTQ